MASPTTRPSTSWQASLEVPGNGCGGRNTISEIINRLKHILGMKMEHPPYACSMARQYLDSCRQNHTPAWFSRLAGCPTRLLRTQFSCCWSVNAGSQPGNLYR